MPIEKYKLDKRLHSVYGLAYPSKLKTRVFYVGVSKVPGKRFEDHLRGDTGNVDKDVIIKQILNRGKRPRLVILERGLTQSQAYTREKYWITKYRKQSPLTNKTSGGKFPYVSRVAAEHKKR